jgi:hypothetical protein
MKSGVYQTIYGGNLPEVLLTHRGGAAAATRLAPTTPAAPSSRHGRSTRKRRTEINYAMTGT